MISKLQEIGLVKIVIALGIAYVAIYQYININIGDSDCKKMCALEGVTEYSYVPGSCNSHGICREPTCTCYNEAFYEAQRIKKEERKLLKEIGL